jgi:hypothetical protein
MTTIRIPCGISVVFEQIDIAIDTFLLKSLFGLDAESLKDPFTRSVLRQKVNDVIALSGCVFRM